MRRLYRATALLMILVFTLGLSGCSLFSKVTFEPTETSIFIKKNGHVIGAEIDDFDNSAFETPRYDAAELQAFVESAVLEYNKGKGLAYLRQSDIEDKETVLPISIEKLEVADNVATVILDYASADDYLSFNGTTYLVPIHNLIVGTVADGNASGLNYDNMLKGDGTAAAGSDIADKPKYYLAAVTGDTLVKFEGKVRYYSSDLTLVDEHTVRSAGENVHFIVFK